MTFFRFSLLPFLSQPPQRQNTDTKERANEERGAVVAASAAAIVATYAFAVSGNGSVNVAMRTDKSRGLEFLREITACSKDSDFVTQLFDELILSNNLTGTRIHR